MVVGQANHLDAGPFQFVGDKAPVSRVRAKVHVGTALVIGGRRVSIGESHLKICEADVGGAQQLLDINEWRPAQH